MVQELKANKYLFDAVNGLNHAMNNDGNNADYNKAAIDLRSIATRIIRYYYVNRIPAYQGKRVDNDEVYPPPGKLLGPLRDYKVVEEEIITWFGHAIDQGDNAAHPEKGIPVDKAIIDSIYKKTDDIIRVFLDEFPSDDGYVDPLRGSVTIKYLDRFYDKRNQRAYPALSPIYNFENKNFNDSSRKENAPRCEITWKADGAQIGKGKYLEFKDEYKLKTITCVVKSKENDNAITSAEFRYSGNMQSNTHADVKLDIILNDKTGKNELVASLRGVSNFRDFLYSWEMEGKGKIPYKGRFLILKPSYIGNTIIFYAKNNLTGQTLVKKFDRPIRESDLSIDTIEERPGTSHGGKEPSRGVERPTPLFSKPEPTMPDSPKKKPLLTASFLEAELAKGLLKTQEDYDAED